MGRKRKGGQELLEGPVDLAARIGARDPSGPGEAAPETIRRVDGPIESDRAARSRHVMIGANELPARVLEQGEPADPGAPAGPPATIGDEAAHAAPPVPVRPLTLAERVEAEPASPVIASRREAPSAGEMDLVVMPLATPDDWHHFELALRRVPGVGPLRVEYYRAGILKLRLQWSGAQRFAHVLADLPGYRVGILGEDRTTVQIRAVRR